MPELDPLGRPPRRPSFAPRSGDFDAMVGRAKRRRRRHYQAAGAGLAGVLAIVAVASVNGAGSVGLDPVQPATGVTASPSTAPSPVPTASPSETPSEEPGASPSEEPDAPPSGEPSPAPGEWHTEAPPSYDADEEPHRPARSRPVFVRDDVANDPAKVCDTDPSFVTAAGWCLRYDGPSRVQSEVPNEYRLLACRHQPGRGGATLTFDTEQQVDFVVTQGQREEWHWSAGYAFPRRETTVRVEEGRCARWTVVWDGTGDDGDPLRAGSYWISPYLMPSDWGAGTGAMGVGSAYEVEITD